MTTDNSPDKHPFLCINIGKDIKPNIISTGVNHDSGDVNLINKEEKSPLLVVIEKILSTPEVTLMAPPFAFGTTEKDTRHNMEILQRHNFSLTEVLSSHPPSPCLFGSKFRDATVLEDIFKNHPKWERQKALLMHGTDYPMVELEPAVRVTTRCQSRNGKRKSSWCTIVSKRARNKIQKRNRQRLDATPSGRSSTPLAFHQVLSNIDRRTNDHRRGGHFHRKASSNP